MKKYLLYQCIVVWWLSAAPVAYGQLLGSRLYTVKDGLPSSFVTCTMIDKQGYLWAGTRYGVAHYDGKTLVKYQPANKPNIFMVRNIIQDHTGRIWAGADNGIFLLERSSARSFPFEDSIFMYNPVTQIKETDDGKLRATTQYGFYEFAGSYWKRIKGSLQSAFDTCVQFDECNNRSLFVYKRKLVIDLPGGTAKIISAKDEGCGGFYSARMDGDMIFVSTDSGLRRLSPGLLKLEPVFEKSFRNMKTLSFFIDSKKRLWVSFSRNGVWVSKPGEYNKLQYHVNDNELLTLHINEDAENNIWLSTRGGLVKATESHIEELGKKRINHISLLLTDKQQHICMLSARDGLYKTIDTSFIADNEYRLPFTGNNTAETFTNWSIDGRKHLWLSTGSGRLYECSKANAALCGRFEYISDIDYDSITDKAWICTDRLLTGNNGKFDEYRSANGGITVRRPWSLTVCTNGNILLVTLDSKIYLIDKNNNCYPFIDQLGLSQVARTDLDTKFFNDPDGGFWITYLNGGLKKFRWASNDEVVKEIDISEKDGLSGIAINSIAFDVRGRLWASTSSGLVVMHIDKNPAAGIFVSRIDNKDQNIHVSDWEETRLLSDSSGNIWFASAHDIYRIRTSGMSLSAQKPGIVIEDIKLNGQGTEWNKWSDSLYGFFRIPKQIELPYHLNTLNISFNAVSFSDDKDLLYAYKVDGLSDSWNESANNGVTLANLAPGRYRFLVRVKKTTTDWSNPAELVIHINAPVWDKWWFRVAIIGLFCVLLYFIYQYRIKQIQRKSHLKDQLQKLEMKALKAQMNPHFIYNALNSIQSLIVDNKQDDSLRYIGKFSRLLRQVLEYSDNNQIPLDKELNALELYIQLEALRLNFELIYSISIDESIMPEYELIPPLILQPYVENALWHGLSLKEGEKRLTIRIDQTTDFLICSISDNGIGREKAGRLTAKSPIHKSSKGMDITSKRLGLVNGNINAVHVKIDDLSDTQEGSTGTRVIIKILRSKSAPY